MSIKSRITGLAASVLLGYATLSYASIQVDSHLINSQSIPLNEAKIIRSYTFEYEGYYELRFIDRNCDGIADLEQMIKLCNNSPLKERLYFKVDHLTHEITVYPNLGFFARVIPLSSNLDNDLITDKFLGLLKDAPNCDGSSQSDDILIKVFDLFYNQIKKLF